MSRPRGWSGTEPSGSISLAEADGRIEQALVVVNPDELAGLVLPAGTET